MRKMNIKLVKWDPIEFGKINGLSYLKISFSRQMEDNPDVKVDKYSFFNSDEAVEITLSYRLSESDTWAPDLGKVPGTFNFYLKK